jgi:hypothetical protein
MYDRQRDLSDEDIGIRAFKTKKAKAAERAVERIRRAQGDSWSSFTAEEIEELEWILGELWAYIAREDWDDLRFGRLSLQEVIRLLTYGSQLRRYARNSIDILRDVEGVVRKEDAT